MQEHAGEQRAPDQATELADDAGTQTHAAVVTGLPGQLGRDGAERAYSVPQHTRIHAGTLHHDPHRHVDGDERHRDERRGIGRVLIT